MSIAPVYSVSPHKPVRYVISDFCIFFLTEEDGGENVWGGGILDYAGCFSEAAGSVD